MLRGFIIGAVAVAISTAPARAELGGKGSDVASESRQISASLVTRLDVDEGASRTYAQTLSDGTLIEQFAAANGQIFAVRWQGAARPNLKTLFGGYFDRFQADNNPAATGQRRKPLGSTHPDFIVRTFGRNGEVSGYAILPTLVPAGFDARALIGE